MIERIRKIVSAMAIFVRRIIAEESASMDKFYAQYE
jgi:hypothetical protein